MANEEIKTAAKKANVYLWEIARYFDLAESTFCRKLRIEFSEIDKTEVHRAIKDIAAAKGGKK